MSDGAFASKILAWYATFGRHDLPWRTQITPYRVWVSEIMLQQTQVVTVLPYYQRFLQQFPDVDSLAAAPLDAVLELWSGLGYYARARNLHRSAGVICELHGGQLPLEREALCALPGIGRSTAGAVLALAAGQREAILDGNVKRVLCRYHAVEGWPGTAPVLRQLWSLAEAHTPKQQVADYTQAIMDLGATLCTRHKPRCELCPLGVTCLARVEGRTQELPASRPRRKLPLRNKAFLFLRRKDGAIFLQRRPPTGIWGGLWSVPECSSASEAEDWCLEQTGHIPAAVHHLEPVLHTFTHFKLEIAPILMELGSVSRVMEGKGALWYKHGQMHALGLPTPVARLLAKL